MRPYDADAIIVRNPLAPAIDKATELKLDVQHLRCHLHDGSPIETAQLMWIEHIVNQLASDLFELRDQREPTNARADPCRSIAFVLARLSQPRIVAMNLS